MSSSITFFAKDAITCPVCKSKFHKEVLRIGGGRIIAGDLEYDLRRSYKPSSKYGLVNPLIYSVSVCPECHYAAMQEDFLKVKGDVASEIREHSDRRKKYAEMIFGEVPDFSESRNLKAGAASFFLAISSYSYFGKDFAPTTKKAICAVRTSWLIKDMMKEDPEGNYDSLYVYFRHLAMKLYMKSIEFAETGQETFDNVGKLGPDVDTDYGYDGLLYMMGLLGYEMGEFMSDEERYKQFFYFRTSLAKVFGFGKASKTKPSSILEIAKDLHGKLGGAIDKIKEDFPDIEEKIQL